VPVKTEVLQKLQQLYADPPPPEGRPTANRNSNLFHRALLPKELNMRPTAIIRNCKKLYSIMRTNSFYPLFPRHDSAISPDHISRSTPPPELHIRHVTVFYNIRNPKRKFFATFVLSITLPVTYLPILTLLGHITDIIEF